MSFTVWQVLVNLPDYLFHIISQVTETQINVMLYLQIIITLCEKSLQRCLKKKLKSVIIIKTLLQIQH